MFVSGAAEDSTSCDQLVAEMAGSKTLIILYINTEIANPQENFHG